MGSGVGIKMLQDRKVHTVYKLRKNKSKKKLDDLKKVQLVLARSPHFFYPEKYATVIDQYPE